MRSRAGEARALMTGFADRTGLTSALPQQRYLWTDAFAVCNFLGLGERDLALRLVDRVHHVLGRHRADDSRAGWIGGLSESEGEAHPTRGGLRIGKPLPERRGDEPFDDALEWERDGQYFHYLTRWMHALDRAGLDLWARELAQTAWKAFASGGRMVWKMSIDLSRSLVASMGQHDPLDGYLTCLQLRAHATAEGPRLDQAIASFEAMISRRALATADPLGLGSLLWDALRAQRLVEAGALRDESLPEALLEAAIDGLRLFGRGRDLEHPAWRRLAFRELGLAIGLHAVERMQEGAASARTRELLSALAPSLPLRDRIESFWLAHCDGAGYADHREINDVMLATALAPEGFL